MISAVSYQFEKFVQFAEERVKAGKDTAIARKGEVRIGGGTALEERAIYATDKTDFVGMTILRGGDTKRANDEVREIFKKSIAEMFGGEGKGTSTIITAGVLDNLDLAGPLRKDPFGTMQKIDELCTYLRKYGLEDLRFNTKQKSDLKALLLTFLQKEKGEKAFQRLIDKCEAEFINRKMYNPYETWKPMHSPDNAYKHFMENREELLKFDTSAVDA